MAVNYFPKVLKRSLLFLPSDHRQFAKKRFMSQVVQAHRGKVLLLRCDRTFQSDFSSRAHDQIDPETLLAEICLRMLVSPVKYSRPHWGMLKSQRDVRKS